MQTETVAALCGALVGGCLTIVANQLQESMRAAARAEQLSHAIAGEVLAILKIVEERGYLADIEALARFAAQGNWIGLNIAARRNYFSTIEANLDSIGLLPAELPILVPRLLVLGKSILEDFESFGQLTETGCPVEQLANRYRELAGLLREAISTGRNIVTLVAAIYGSPHRRLPLNLRLLLLLRQKQEWSGY